MPACSIYKNIIRCDLYCNKKQIRNRDPQSIAITLTVRNIGRAGKVFVSVKPFSKSIRFLGLMWNLERTSCDGGGFKLCPCAREAKRSGCCRREGRWWRGAAPGRWRHSNLRGPFLPPPPSESWVCLMAIRLATACIQRISWHYLLSKSLVRGLFVFPQAVGRGDWTSVIGILIFILFWVNPLEALREEWHISSGKTLNNTSQEFCFPYLPH